MALQPLDNAHALQIQAGTFGRKAGHTFEDTLTQRINDLAYPLKVMTPADSHVLAGDPALLCLNYIAYHHHIRRITSASALSTGALATSEDGKRWLSINGASVSRCKSDLVLTITTNNKRHLTIGVSIKQCNNSTPTNAQLYFTTARGFSSLLRNNGLTVSETAVRALRQFCGDEGFLPSDDPRLSAKRLTDPRRWFWEQIDTAGRLEWEQLFSDHQDTISRLLFQKAYIDDPFAPDYLLHKTRRAASWNTTEVAIYSIEELIALSRAYQGFATRQYSVRKGSYKDPTGVTHLAPRFGIIQMQRGGQKQHPEQLQFNLEAGYFYKL
ncbi:MAG: hypothetical protein Q8N47_01785 [Bryobacterales bacterium]|nr:hypothetical protein [Bryobacterales bacterium]